MTSNNEETIDGYIVVIDDNEENRRLYLHCTEMEDCMPRWGLRQNFMDAHFFFYRPEAVIQSKQWDRDGYSATIVPVQKTITINMKSR